MKQICSSLQTHEDYQNAQIRALEHLCILSGLGRDSLFCQNFFADSVSTSFLVVSIPVRKSAYYTKRTQRALTG
jgi:hypothetical protein